ncbi:MAG: hypothetical protein ACOYOO_01065 [Saprospiraceae bacterium]|jgi:hypothetical protein
MGKYLNKRSYISRRERIHRHYRGWKMVLLLLLLATVIWIAINIKEVMAYLHTFTY